MCSLCFMFSPLRFFLSTGAARVNTLKLNIAVKSGSSGIIPCVYDKQHKENHKYLCWGRIWSSCHIYAGKTGKYSITDYPDQSIFTVRWDKLEISDSGYYWCAVEIGDKYTLDAGYYLYLTVQSGKKLLSKLRFTNYSFVF